MLAVEIIVNGWINEDWCDWLGGLTVIHSESNHSLLKGSLPDQSAVYGVISRLRDLGIPLASVNIEAIEPDNS